MENLNLLLFISFAAPLLTAVILCKNETRIFLSFLFIGMVVCLFTGEVNALLMNVSQISFEYFTSNYSPLIEEFFKAIPILIFAFIYKPEKKVLLESSILLGVGFAILENAFVIGYNAEYISISMALIRGFGAGIMHSLCSYAVGYGMTYVHINRKLFYTGTIALLSVATIYHSIYNTVVQSINYIYGFFLPVITLLLILLITKIIRTKKSQD